MTHILDYRYQSITYRYRFIFIIVFLMLFTPITGWAHTCGPSELTVGNGETIEYSIKGSINILEYKIVEQGDPLVMEIKPPEKITPNITFEITGTGAGNTVFELYWRGSHRQDTCIVEVTVSE